jgi:hypothetical protein
MSTKLQRAWRLVESAARLAKTREGRTSCEDVQIHVGYAEPGYGGDDAIVACGNWNTCGRWDAESNRHVTTDDMPKRLGDALDRMGVSCEWEDEWTTCDECNKLVRTSPDCYSWTPSYTSDEDGCGTVCESCTLADTDAYLESLEGDTRKAITLNVDPADHGYVLVQDDFEHGFHHGQDADPKVIGAALRKRGVKRFVFKIVDQGQFDTRFAVYVHEDEASLVKEPLPESEVNGPSVSGAMERGLREATAKMSTLEGDGIKLATVNTDGTADVRLVSREDFVRGIKS